MKLLVLVVFVCAVFDMTEASRVRKCGTEEPPTEVSDINLSACAKLPCKLKRKSSVDITIKFTPDSDKSKVFNSVHALILGVPFPFIGVDGNSICGKVLDSNGKKASCPLKGGQEYTYKDSFNVLEIYPKLKVWVHWSLNDEKGDSIKCFEVPVKITS